MTRHVDHYVNIFTGESTDTIREALDALQAIEPIDQKHAANILAVREGLLRKLDEAAGLQTQGRLF